MNILYPSKIKISNLGDILINVLLIKELTNYGVVYLDRKNFLLEKIINSKKENKNLKFISSNFLFKIPVLRWISIILFYPKFSFLFDPPGAYGQPNGLIKYFIKRNKYYCRVKILSLFNIKLIRYGVSYGKFDKSALAFEKKISDLYYSISLRDKNNFKYLKSSLFSNINLTKDLSFLFDGDDFIFENINEFKIESNFIVISFRGSVLGGPSDYEYINNIKKSISDILASPFYSDFSIVFTFQVKEDFEVTYDLYKFISEETSLNTFFINKQLNFGQACYLYKRASFLFSNRLHVCLWGLLLGSPSFVLTDLSVHLKIVGIFKELDLSDFLIDLNDSNFDLLKLNLESLLENFNKSCSNNRSYLKEDIRTLLSNHV